MRRLALLTLALTLAVCGSAAARDPGRWTLAGWSSVSNNYWQGVSSAGPGQPLFFTGPVEGLHRTARNLRQTGSVGSVIPPSVKAVEGYNHVGDPLWTSSGPDLLAYRASDVSAGNAAPGAAPIRAVRRLPRAVPPSGVTGAAIYRGRLLLAGTQGTTYQVWSVDTDTGARRLELELPRVQGEAEGLTQIPLLGGRLHFVVAPLAANPTFGPSVGMLHFATGRWARRGLRVTVRAARQSSRRPRVRARVTRR